MLKGKNVALFVTGGIAVYKAVDLLRTFIKEGATVRVAMTDSATEFVSPLTFQILSKQAVHVDTFSEEDPANVQHIHLADWADIAVVAPATANTMAKMVQGIADNFVTSTLLATTAPLFVVPAMNTHMYEHPASQENRDKLRKRGAYVMEPDTGFLAEGYEGKGRYPENQRILEEVEQFLIQHQENLPLKGKKVIVTAGGTKERLDPVRYLSNDSSGKMGHAIAKEAYAQGAEVTLITASSLPVPSFLKTKTVQSAKDMYDAVSEEFDIADILVMSAAVSDYAPAVQANQKMKKQEEFTLELKKNPDILKEMGGRKKHQFLVGFAAETKNIEAYAMKKLEEKRADMIVANDVGKKDRGFNVDENEVHLFTKESAPIHVPLRSKTEVAKKIIETTIEKLEKR